MDGKDDDFYKTLLDNLHDGVYYCDWERKITFWNKAAEEITGYVKEEIMGTHCFDNILVHVNAKGENLCKSGKCPAELAMKENRMVKEEIFLKHKDGYRVPVSTRITPIRDEHGKVIGAVEIFRNNTENLIAFQKIERLQALAFIDELTEVGNRRYTEIRLLTKFEEWQRHPWRGEFGVLFVDIDNFKKFNDTYGHETGDRVLKYVAKTMLTNVRIEDFVGRWGGEEFIVIVSSIDTEDLYGVAEKLRELVASSGVTVDKEPLKVTVSIGATIAKPNENIASIVSRADKLMYDSKNAGKNRTTMDK